MPNKNIKESVSRDFSIILLPFEGKMDENGGGFPVVIDLYRNDTNVFDET